MVAIVANFWVYEQRSVQHLLQMTPKVSLKEACYYGLYHNTNDSIFTP
jgi:hypothetical protein